MRRAIGFDNDAELRDSRERALNFIKGDMAKDVPSLPNRSKAVSSDINDAVENVHADLMEILTGGDDVVAFIPTTEEDVEAAQQETAYLSHVAFQDNEGFLNFSTAIKDALILKTGILMVEWVKNVSMDDEDFTGKNAIEMQLASQDGEISNVKPDSAPDGVDIRQAEPTYSFTVTKTDDRSQAKYWAIAPDDFAVAPDTINIADATYCCARFRPRVQDLIADGYDPEKVRGLPQYQDENTVMQIARDTAGEHKTTGSESTDAAAGGDLRQVEIRKHYIRKLSEDNKELELWCLVTDAQATMEIDREEVERIPFACGAPYMTPHRFYGRSLADLLVEIQKIRTALTRGMLDSMYFSLNQRLVVADDDKNDYTISDVLRPEPGAPIRVKRQGAVQAVTAGGPGFEYDRAMEFFATVAETRTGVVRNANGLNPDTLHDTASGAMMLLSAAQKMKRMMARILAETMVKPFFLLLHATIRENDTAQRKAKLLGKWVPVSPTEWKERTAMTVEVGLGASGKDMEIAAMTKVAGLMTSIVQEQGGADGPIVTLQNAYQAAVDFAKKIGVKAPEKYFSDPATAEPKPPRPDPEMIKIQGEQQLKQTQMQADAQHQQLKAANDHQAAQDKIASEQAVAVAQAQAKAQADQHAQVLEHARMQQQQSNQMTIEQMKIESAERIAIAVARINAEAKISAAMAAAKIDQQTTLEYEEQNEGAGA